MDKNQDQYKTIRSNKDGIVYKEKNSKFLAYTFAVDNEADIKLVLETLRNDHMSANHICYAWQLGVQEISYRVQDDGEPNHSAGTPIYGQIQAFEVTNVLVVVIRYFGGIKLGIGGLISAYRTAAQMALKESKIIKRTLQAPLYLEFEYVSMNKVMRFIKKHSLKIASQTMDMKCQVTLTVRKSQVTKVKSQFLALQNVKVRE